MQREGEISLRARFLSGPSQLPGGGGLRGKHPTRGCSFPLSGRSQLAPRRPSGLSAEQLSSPGAEGGPEPPVLRMAEDSSSIRPRLRLLRSKIPRFQTPVISLISISYHHHQGAELDLWPLTHLQCAKKGFYFPPSPAFSLSPPLSEVPPPARPLIPNTHVGSRVGAWRGGASLQKVGLLGEVSIILGCHCPGRSRE